MRRRDFIAMLGGAAVAWPLAARAQQSPGKLHRVAFLETSALRAHLWEAFRQELRQLGYIENESVAFERRWADGDTQRLPALAGELVDLKPDVIVTGATTATQAARRATNTIPIVMASVNDPVGVGLVASLARPGGNATGVATLTKELSGKRLEILREMVPHVSRVAVVWDQGNSSANAIAGETTNAAASLAMPLRTIGIGAANELESAYGALKREGVAALIVISSPAFFGERRRLADLAAKHRLPAMYTWREYAEAGGLVAYGSDLKHQFRRAAVYVDKILRGAKPADLPVEQPTKFELVINLKTATTLGLVMPPTLLARADEVIE